MLPNLNTLDNPILNFVRSIEAQSILLILLTIILIAILTSLVAKMVDRTLKRYFMKVGGVGKEAEKTIQSISRRLLVATIYLIGFILIIMQIPHFQRVAVAMLAGAGLAAIAIGLAAQDSLSNVISGVFLAVFQPFRVGDYVDFNGEYGEIEDLTLRHTVIHTWDKRRLIVPNSVMSQQTIINWSIIDPVVTWVVDIGIAYTANIDTARSIILDVAKHHPMVLKDHEMLVRVAELGDFAVNLRLTIDVLRRDVAYTTGCEIRESVKKRFDAEGVEIPYPYRNIIFHRAS